MSDFHHSYTLPLNAKAAIDNMEMNECGCVPIKLYLQKLMVAQV